MYVVRGAKSLDFELSEFFLSNEANTAKGFAGDTVTVRGRVFVEARGSFLKEHQPLEVNLIKDGTVVQTYDLESPFKITYYDKDTSKGKSYYRVEIKAKGLHLITNPIFIHRM